jgi:RNA polymerase sigma-70 factor (ECF subfamily)
VSVRLDRSTDVLRALDALPPAQRRVVVLHHLHDMSVVQIAAHTARPVRAVQADLARGQARLASLLRDGVAARPSVAV